MGVKRYTAFKSQPSVDLGEGMMDVTLDLCDHRRKPVRKRTKNVWCVIWSASKYVIFFCLGMVVGSLFLSHGPDYRECVNTMKAIGFGSHRTKLICLKFINGVSDSIPRVKFDCLPRGPYDAKSCGKLGCLWSSSSHSLHSVDGVPLCFYPDKYGSYINQNVTQSIGLVTASMHKKIKSPYPSDIETVQFRACSETSNRLHIKLTDAKKDRFEPFLPSVPTVECQSSGNDEFIVEISEGKTGFKILRASSKKVIFDAEDVGGFTYADQFLQLSAVLPSDAGLYGIGENQGPLAINTSIYQTFTLWNHDYAPKDGVNLYGSHPFLLVRDYSDEKNTKWHGLFLLNSNAMEIVTQPGPAVTFRTIGGIFDFYWFMGSTPSDVTRQYLELIGNPVMPPYWGLGFHLCRFGYGSLNRTMQVWNQTRAAGIPFDVQWNDIDYMDKANDFTIGEKFAKLPDFVETLHKVNMHYIPMIDPGISASEKPGGYIPYDTGLQLGIFITDEKNKPFVGKVWNKISTVWPDFTNPKVIDYWTNMLDLLHQKVKFDGAWIDMNEPSNFYDGTVKGCPKNSKNNPPYVPRVDGGKLYYKTVCPSAKQYKGIHYDLHNMYGISEAIATAFALTQLREGRRPVIISRSTFPGHGHFAGAWTGDVFSEWFDLKRSISQILNFNMFGIPLIGADICGFNGNTSVELCARWMELGAFYPFSRNHNTDDAIDQDPVSLGEDVIRASRNALKIRYSLLPYLYYLFYDAHMNGRTVARPLFYEFPSDANTYKLDTQFMWGRCLLIVPVLTEGQKEVEGYFPQGQWYEWTSNLTIDARQPLRVILEAPLHIIPVFARGGCILPTQTPKATTAESRLTPIILRVYLDGTKCAEGQVYFDDGEQVGSIEEGKYSLFNMSVQDKTLTVKAEVSGYNEIPKLGAIIIFGECSKVTSVVLNGQSVKEFTSNPSECILSVSTNVNLLKGITMSWKTKGVVGLDGNLF